MGDLKQYRTGRAAGAVALLFGAVSLLLVITVSNISSLMLAQLDQRGREIAIRLSIGATRGQIVRALAKEMTIVAGAAGLGGYALARFSMALLAKLFAETPRIAELAVDTRELVFALLAVQLLLVALIGEYVGRIYTEAKGRPYYLVNEVRRFSVTARVPEADHLESSP